MELEKTLGYPAAQALVYDLENYDIALVAGKAPSYALEQVEEALNKVRGAEASVLVMDQLMKILEQD